MRSLLILAGLAVSLAASSQEIYRWVDKDGIVHYSDHPGSDKAKLIDVVEPNAYEAAEAAPGTGSGGDSSGSGGNEKEASSYASLSITSPEPDQVFFGADEVIRVQANLSGTLQPGHQVVFFLNGNRRPAPDLALDLSGLDRGSYTLRATVLDQNGKLLISSEQITFHVRQPSIRSPQSPQAPPKPGPKPTPLPATKPPAAR